MHRITHRLPPDQNKTNKDSALNTLVYGVAHHRGQISQQLVQVFLVGLTIGTLRTVVPALAEAEFGLASGSFLLLTSFVVAFGVVKGVMNFVAGHLAERHGRRPVLLLGWLAALPIPVLVWWAPSWSWIVVATVLLGINQGLCWSMTQTAKLDITRADERGLVMGFNEFSGYLGLAVAGIVTGYLASYWEPRTGLLVFGLAVIGSALALTLTSVRETRPWAHATVSQTEDNGGAVAAGGKPEHTLSTAAVFRRTSWEDRRLFAFCQAGLVEKFVDALVWVFYPVYFFQRGVDLDTIGWIVGTYGIVWGLSQLWTGKLSDHVGRRLPIISGMWLCGAGVALTPLGSSVAWWLGSAALTGLGMALLYPNLSAAVADAAQPAWRAAAIGVYRFWRDLGYAIGALAFGLIAHATGAVTAGFWFVALSMAVSGAVVVIWGSETLRRGTEYHPTGDTA